MLCNKIETKDNANYFLLEIIQPIHLHKRGQKWFFAEILCMLLVQQTYKVCTGWYVSSWRLKNIKEGRTLATFFCNTNSLQIYHPALVSKIYRIIKKIYGIIKVSGLLIKLVACSVLFYWYFLKKWKMTTLGFIHEYG